MFKKIGILILGVILLTSCGNKVANDQADETKNKGKYETFTIKLNLTNPEDKDPSYLVYFLVPGTKKTEPGEATQGGYYGPFETDENGEVNIDMDFNWDIRSLIEQTDDNKLEIFVTTKEDIYIRNPLNEPAYIEFVKNNDADTKINYSYYSTVASQEIDITDKYPDGVYSLTFPDATFVIKLKFHDGFEHDNAYLVTIARPDTNGNEIGAERNGRLARDFQYWDTPFFESDSLSAWNGTIIVSDYDTNEIVNYEEYPKRVTFDANGKCNEGNIITITIK